MRVGYLPEAFGEGATEIDHAALAAARRLGIKVVEVSLADLPYGALMNILYAEAAAAFEELTFSDIDDTLTWQDDGAWPNTFRKARFLSAVDHVQLDRLRYQVMLALDGTFGDIDALIGPFMTGPMLIASNFTGHPCLHLRAGFFELGTRGAASLGDGKLTTGEEDKSGRMFTVPQGISLWGRLFEEAPILNLGMALERELGVATRRPAFPEDRAGARDGPTPEILGGDRAAIGRDPGAGRSLRRIQRDINSTSCLRGPAILYQRDNDETQGLSEIKCGVDGRRRFIGALRSANCWHRNAGERRYADLGPFRDHAEPRHAPDRHCFDRPRASERALLDRHRRQEPLRHSKSCAELRAERGRPDLHVQAPAGGEISQRQDHECGGRQILVRALQGPGHRRGQFRGLQRCCGDRDAG